MASESIAHEAEPIRARGIIVKNALNSTNQRRYPPEDHLFYFFCFPLYSTITRNTLTINETAINTNYCYTRIIREADLSVYCLALPSLNKIDTYIHTEVKKSLRDHLLDTAV